MGLFLTRLTTFSDSTLEYLSQVRYSSAKGVDGIAVLIESRTEDFVAFFNGLKSVKIYSITGEIPAPLDDQLTTVANSCRDNLLGFSTVKLCFVDISYSSKQVNRVP